jgi:hypothetical protein
MDPYYDVQADTVNLIKQLRGTQSRSDQQTLIADIELQIADLSEMLVLITKNRNRISDREFQARKQFVADIKAELRAYKSKMERSDLINVDFEAPPSEPPVEISEASTQTYMQQYIKTNIAEQDVYLTEIGRSLDTLKQINYQIGDELTAQDAVIDDLSELTKDTEDRLREGSKKIDKVMVSTASDTKTQIVGVVALSATILGLFTALVHL